MRSGAMRREPLLFAPRRGAGDASWRAPARNQRGRDGRPRPRMDQRAALDDGLSAIFLPALFAGEKIAAKEQPLLTLRRAIRRRFVRRLRAVLLNYAAKAAGVRLRSRLTPRRICADQLRAAVLLSWCGDGVHAKKDPERLGDYRPGSIVADLPDLADPRDLVDPLDLCSSGVSARAESLLERKKRPFFSRWRGARTVWWGRLMLRPVPFFARGPSGAFHPATLRTDRRAASRRLLASSSGFRPLWP